MSAPRRPTIRRPTITALTLVAVPVTGGVLVPHSAAAQPADSAAVVAAVQAFHEALRSADTAAVRDLLADDVVVGEGGGLETRDEYLSGQLRADMAFAAAVTREPRMVRVVVAGDVAWTLSASHATGTFRERTIDSRGAELMVLSREGERWRIRAIHWFYRS